MASKVALITGSAKRIGAAIAEKLHQENINVIIHYRHSQDEAEKLCEKLNAVRHKSAVSLFADLNNTKSLKNFIAAAERTWQRLDYLINNASNFYPTPFGNIEKEHWQDLLASNLTAPFFLSQAAYPLLKKNEGSIINITDIHAKRPLKNYSVYCIAKAGLVMLTKSLAKELAPEVRVNAVAPGSIIWPTGDNELDRATQEKIIAKTCLKRLGKPLDIAKAVLFLIKDAPYITGQIISVDGGRLLNG